MKKKTIAALGIVFALAIACVFLFGDFIPKMTPARLQLWDETFPICRQFCIDKGGEYSNHEVIFAFYEKLIANGIKCECKGMEKACVENYCFNGYKETFELRK